MVFRLLRRSSLRIPQLVRMYTSWGALKLTFSIMALLKRLISTISMLRKALIWWTSMLFSIFLQKSQNIPFWFLIFFFAIWYCNEKTGRKDSKPGTPFRKAVKKKNLKKYWICSFPQALLILLCDCPFQTFIDSLLSSLMWHGTATRLLAPFAGALVWCNLVTSWDGFPTWFFSLFEAKPFRKPGGLPV